MRFQLNNSLVNFSTFDTDRPYGAGALTPAMKSRKMMGSGRSNSDLDVYQQMPSHYHGPSQYIMRPTRTKSKKTANNLTDQEHLIPCTQIKLDFSRYLY